MSLSVMPWVYVAGPYTNGDTAMHVVRACKVADELHTEGFVPFVPHLTHLWHLISPHPVDFWYDLDLHHLMRCDMLVRLPGQSSGADREVERAIRMGMPVVYLEDCSIESIEKAAEELRAAYDHQQAMRRLERRPRYFYVIGAASGPYSPSPMVDDESQARRDAEKAVRDLIGCVEEEHPAAPAYAHVYMTDGGHVAECRFSTITADIVTLWRNEENSK